MASHRPFSLNCLIQSPVFPLFWIENLKDLQELECPSNGLANNQEYSVKIYPSFLLPSGYVPKQVEPAYVVTAFPQSPIKSKNMIIKTNPQRNRTCSFKIKRHLQSTSLLLINIRDLQVPLIAFEVDGLTSATQSLAPCTDLHCSFFRYLTSLSHSTFTA
jgi:hypothetical protein